MEAERTGSGIVLLDYRDALLRWSKSWAELAKSDTNVASPSVKFLDDHDSDAGYGSEGTKFYVGSKADSDSCLSDEEDACERPADADLDENSDPENNEQCDEEEEEEEEDEEVEEEDLSCMRIEMIGNECVLVNPRPDDDVPCPTEESRDGLTPDVNCQYNHEELVDLACRFLAYFEGRSGTYVNPKIYWAMLNAPDFGS